MTYEEKDLTPVFGMDVQPEREGVYSLQHRTVDRPLYSRWDGAQWNSTSLSTEDAAEADERSLQCYGYWITGWRGLNYDPATCQEGGAP